MEEVGTLEIIMWGVGLFISGYIIALMCNNNIGKSK